jgi:hypothetical protein
VHVDDAAVRTIKVGDKKKRDGYDYRQDEQEELAFATLAVADQEVTEECHQGHHRHFGAVRSVDDPERKSPALASRPSGCAADLICCAAGAGPYSYSDTR